MTARPNFGANRPPYRPPQFTPLPTRYIFAPTPKQLIVDFLKNKILEAPLPVDWIPTVHDLYSKSPDELPLTAHANIRRDNEWYFFTARPLHSSIIVARGGYYSVVIGEEEVQEMEDIIYNADDSDEIVGLGRTLVFYRGNLPFGMKSGYTIYEYRINPAILGAAQHSFIIRERVEKYVVCKIVRGEDNQPTDSLSSTN